MLCDECIIVEVRIGLANARDLLLLPRREILLWVEAPGSLEQSLASQLFVDAGDTAVEVVRGIEDRAVAVGELYAIAEPTPLIERPCLPLTVQPLQQLHAPARPHRPLPEQTADDTQRRPLRVEGKLAQQV